MKLLIVESDRPTVEFLCRRLSEGGFEVDAAATAAEADDLLATNGYDAILLDVMLPETDGFGLCKRWREDGVTVPILILTARDDVADRVRGLESGGDDYLVKPFAFAELLARVKALLRRPRGFVGSAEIRVGDLGVDTAHRRVRRGERAISLSTREYQLLEYLARNTGSVLSRSALWRHVWKSTAEPDSNVVDVYVRYLRNKLGREPDLIRTVRGGGYVLEAPDASSASASATG